MANQAQSTGGVAASGGGSAWGSITGTLSAQTDLQAALDAKLTLAYRGISALRTLDSTDELVNVTSGTFTVTLPTAVGFTQQYTVKNSGTGITTIATTSSQTIDGAASGSLNLTQGDSYTFRSNGANWIIEAGGKKVYTYTVTIAAATFRAIGTAPVDITPTVTLPSNCYVNVDESSIFMRKKAVAGVYNFGEDIMIGYTAQPLVVFDFASINNSASNIPMHGQKYLFATTNSLNIGSEPFYVYTQGGTDATTGGGDVVITYRWSITNLS